MASRRFFVLSGAARALRYGALCAALLVAATANAVWAKPAGSVDVVYVDPFAMTPQARAMARAAGRTTPGDSYASLESYPSASTPLRASAMQASQKNFVKIGAPYQANGVWYVPANEPSYDEVGVASWYGDDFHGRNTSNGEAFDMNVISAAHPTLPMPSVVEVTNLENGKKLMVRVNDRGPFVKGRLIDLSRRAAQELGFYGKGAAKVRVRYVGPAPVDGGVGEYANQQQAATPQSVQDVQYQPQPYQQPAAISSTALPPPQAPAEQLKPAPQPAAARATYPPIQTAPKPVYAAGVSASGQFVQIGAFSDAGNAERLRAKMANVAPVSVKTMQSADGRTLYRVVAGPWADSAQALGAKDQMLSLGFNGARVVTVQ